MTAANHTATDRPHMTDQPAAQEIEALLAERVEAMRTHDAARAIATLSPDVVAFELAPPLSLRPDEARDIGALEAWFGGWQGPLEVEIKDLKVEASGDLAFTHSLNRLSGTRPGGRAVSFWMRSTLGLRRSEDGWKIIHAHTSVPFHMDGSFRAALDLEP